MSVKHILAGVLGVCIAFMVGVLLVPDESPTLGAQSNSNNILWKLSGGNLLPSLASWGLSIPSLGSAGDCLVTDAQGVVTTDTCGGGGTSPFTDEGTVISSTDGESLRVDFVTATSTVTSSTFVNVSITDLLLNNSVYFTPVTAPSYAEGRVFYDADTNSLSYYNDVSDVMVNLGQEILVEVFNDSGVTITNGSPVYVNGNNVGTQLPTIALAQADTEATAGVDGVVTADIPNNSTGYVTALGVVRGLDTSTLNNGDLIYLSPTVAGAYTTTKPSRPDWIVEIGRVNFKNAVNGEIYVRITEDIGALLNVVEDTTPQLGGDLDTQGNDITGLNTLSFNTTPVEPIYAEGNVYWDATDKTLIVEQGVDSVKLQVGQELYIRVRNETGVTITNGQAVYISGVTGNRPTIALARANAALTSELLGIVTHDIENNTDGLVTVAGKVNDIDTSTFLVDDTVYLSSATAGGLQNTAPASPDFVIPVGKVLTSNVATGKILITPLPFKSGVTSIDGLRVHSGIQDTTLTASQILITDSSKNITSGSTATYPSLTELTYLKGVTSAIQTQLNGKEGTLTNSAGLAAALSDETGTGLAVFGTSPILTTPNLGTPSAVTLTNGTGLPVATGIAGLGVGVATWLATPSSANLAAAVTGETGTGALVFGTSPTFTTGVNLPSSAIDSATEIANDIITNAQIDDADQASTMCLSRIENPTAADDFESIWANKTTNDFLLTAIWGESDQTVAFDLQIDDGTPADVSGTDITPAAGEAEDTTLAGDTTLAAGEELDLIITSVTNTPTWVSICWTGNWID